MAEQIPFVDYLVLGDDPHLVVNQCSACGARFFDRRNACGCCSGTEFEKARVTTDGELRSFTIVAFAAPGVPVPYVAGIVDCDGTTVRSNIVNVEPDAEHVKLGMPVRLTTLVVGSDSEGVEAVNFAYEPAA
ncbi:MAG: OB-fold domain-containing protein [Deltaproteobacteria bacterium]|nr:OB-fold domain-containing protein [Deltaproteobacteria bacterium]